MAIELSDQELDSLTTALYNRYKVDFTGYQKKTMKAMVGKAMNKMGFTDMMQLWSSLLKDKSTFLQFVDNVTVGMTSMFRGPDMWKALKTEVLFDLKRKGGGVKAFHAGCSTGEEVYTFGIILKELGIQDKSKALAVDLNRDSVKISEAGEYYNLTLRQNESQFLQYNPIGRFNRFYKPLENGRSYKMNRDLISHVTFREGNLVHDEFDTGYDIIFCRNVLIYFDSELKERVIKKFFDALKPGGYLVLGFFDSTRDVSQEYFEKDLTHLRLYKKPLDA